MSLQCRVPEKMLVLALLAISHASAVSIVSSSLRIAQPWHPRFSRVRLADGSISLERVEDSEPMFLQEDAEQSEHCDCDDRASEKSIARKATALVQLEHKTGAVDAVLDAVLPVPAAVQEQPRSSVSVDLKSLKQAESTLERQEAEIHRQMMLLQQRVQQAEQSEQVQQPALQQIPPQQWQNSFQAAQAPQQWQSMLQMPQAPQAPQQPWQQMPQSPQAWAMPQAVYPQLPMQVQGYQMQPQPQMAASWPMMPNYAQMMPAPMQYAGFR
eukprot:TRINITY_DN76158_c0_g1_i1.p1 TRINITY_DN76158_c0_g1~~TRINITY_DN76158_c0_g1_i1.p1  ORF type:complete len:269 (+),score=74.49 TRINITY_DN76158_c0_g1_i1:62-868(+)